MISAIRNYAPNLAFGAAQVNILATADNHGNVHSLPRLTKTIEDNKKDIFIKKDEKSTLNILAIAGDWFINPSKKGFLTKPDMTNGEIQQLFLNKTVNFVQNLAGGKSSNFDALFVMGNHDLDGGDKFMYKVMEESPVKMLMTNIDWKKSPKIRELAESAEHKAVRSMIYEVPDDKNSNIKHKVLFIGVTIPSMDFYNPGLLKDMDFLDNCNKKDANLTEVDLVQTFDAVASTVYKFKHQNPKGAVVLLSHTGANISKMIRDYVPEINVILNGHDHKNLTSLKGKTNINSLGKDNELIKSLNLRFNDDGDLETTDMNVFYTKVTDVYDLKDNEFQRTLEENFAKDMEPLIKIKDAESEKSVELGFSEDIRFKNDYLANYLTSAIKREVRDIDPEINAVGIQSSIIRGGLKDGSCNLDLKKVFDGVSEDLSNVQIGKIKGDELVSLIVENIESNLKDKTRNTIIQWSDVKVNKTMIADILANKPPKKVLTATDFAEAIEIRPRGGKHFKEIDLTEEYKIAIGEKYLVKDDIIWPGKIRDRFVSLDKTYDELFNAYLTSPDINHNCKITAKTREQRII